MGGQMRGLVAQLMTTAAPVELIGLTAAAYIVVALLGQRVDVKA
ncbi:MAG TPA: hypothetical protein VM100_06165 [Longimicrobiales bacterium]|nr:hypothetical protein [Longimicrobiales bacterium]